MNSSSILSIVTPTRGNFSAYWLEQLLQVEGVVEFVLVYPPSTTPKVIEDVRVKTLISPSKGEIMQRFIGLLNASGKYVLALDDDDFVHPEIVKLTIDYFARFPDSWMLRLKMQKIDISQQEEIKSKWQPIPDISQLEVCKKTEENPFPFQQGNYTGLLEVPIAPLDKKTDFRYIFLPSLDRKDSHGIHLENFNNKIWRTELVKEALVDLAQSMKFVGNLSWIPLWGLDRLLGLFVQAKFFQQEAIIGHWLPNPGQIRFITRPAKLKELRLNVQAEILLIKCFPQYGYFWNLIFWEISLIPRTMAKVLKTRLSKA